MANYLFDTGDSYGNYRVILILDKAGWHIGQALKPAGNIKLPYLNPYSPEQDPVELLWREICRKYFHNVTFEDLDEVESVLQKALLHYHKNGQDVRQLDKGFLPI